MAENTANDPKKSPAFSDMAEKFGLLLSKTKDALLKDLENEVVSVQLFMEEQDRNLAGAKSVKDFKDVFDAIFLRLGLDFSDYEFVSALGDKLTSAIETIENVGGSISEFASAGGDKSAQLEALLDKGVPAVKSLVELIQNLSEDEAEKVMGDIKQAGTDLRSKIENFDWKGFIRKIVDHVLMVLLKNAKEVFAAEIDFVRLKAIMFKDEVKEVIDTLKDEKDKVLKQLTDTANTVKEEVDAAKNLFVEAYKDAEATVESVVDDVKKEFTSVVDGYISDAYNAAKQVGSDAGKAADDALARLQNFLEDPETAEAIAKVANAFGITYSILEFLGVVAEKQIDIKLPSKVSGLLVTASNAVSSKAEDIKSAINSATKAVTGKVNEGVEIIDGAFEDARNAIVDGTQSAIAEANKGIQKAYDKVVVESKDKIAEALSSAGSAVSDELKELGEDVNPEEMPTLASVMQVSQASVSTVTAQMASISTRFDNFKPEFPSNWVGDIGKELENISDEVLSEISNVASGINSGIEGAANTFNNAISTVSDKIAETVKKVTEFSYPLKITVIEWEKFGDIFTSPISYFKQLYPIDSADDIQALLDKVMGILHRINPDIPDFSSLMKLLEGLLKKLKEIVADAVEEARNEVLQAVKPLIDTIENIIKMLKDLAATLQAKLFYVVDSIKENVAPLANKVEAIVTLYYRELCSLGEDLGGDLEKAYKNAAKAIEDAGAEVKDGVDSVASEVTKAAAIVADSAGKTSRAIALAARDREKEAEKALKEALAQAEGFGQKMLAILKSIEIEIPTLQGFDLNAEIIAPAFAGFLEFDVNVDGIADDLKSSLNSALDSVGKNAKEKIVKWAVTAGQSIKDVTNPKLWIARLGNVSSQLQAEFINDMNSVTSLISAEGAKRLITNFDSTTKSLADSLDINDYVVILQTALNDVIIPNPEMYFDSFKAVCEDILKSSADTLKKALSDILEKAENLSEQTMKNFQDKIATLESDCTKLLEDFATNLWKQVKNKIINPVINSLKKTLITAIRRIIRVEVQELLEYILNKEDVQGFLKKIADAKKTLENAAEDAAPILTKVEDTVGEWTQWYKEVFDALTVYLTSDRGVAETITLVMSLFNSVPDSVRGTIKGLLPSLPSLPSNEFTDFCKSMDYHADLDNLFFSINILDLAKLEKFDKNTNGKVIDPRVDLKLTVTAFVDDYIYNSDSEEKNTSGLYVYVLMNAGVGLAFKVGKSNMMSMDIDGGTGGTEDGKSAVGFCVTKKVNGDYFHNMCDVSMLGALFRMSFWRCATEPARLIQSEYIDFSIKNYPADLYIGYNPKADLLPEKIKKADSRTGLQAGIVASIEDAEFLLKLKENKLLSNFVKDDISLIFSTYLGYDLQTGLQIGGDVNLHFVLDLEGKKLGPLTLNTFGVTIGSLKNKFGSVAFGVDTSFDVDISAVKFSFEEMGLSLGMQFLDDNYKFKALEVSDLQFNFKYPSGIGISIDCPAVTGTGLLSIDAERGEFTGALELNVIDKFGVAGFLTCDTGAVSKQFSLVAMLSFKFKPGIPLGMGFSLTAIGGGLGLHREMDREAIISGVHQGTLGSVFFVDNLKEHMGEMRASIYKFFPVKKNQFFVGLLGEISYEPVLSCQFGLFLQLPKPVEFIIVGQLKVAPEGLEDIIRINVLFAGGINFEEGIWFDAALVDSMIVGLTIAGGMAFRLFWAGKSKGFLLTIGGFHPAYQPEERMMVSEVKRLSIGLDYDIVSFNLTAYMAVTSNSFQIGAGMQMQVGWDKFGIKGHASFDALFQFDPFLFMFDLEAGVSVVCGSWNLMSVDLSLSVSGPAPWKVSGSAKFIFILIPIKVHFSLKWGDEAPQLPSETISVLDTFTESFENSRNWTATTRAKTNFVTLRNENAQDTYAGQAEEDKDPAASGPMVLNPFSTISFNQSQVPFNEEMQICNNARPTDYSEIHIASLQFGADHDSTPDYLQNDFAPALYKAMTVEQKLESDSYVKYDSGFVAGTDKLVRPNGGVLTVIATHYSYDPASADSLSSNTKSARKITPTRPTSKRESKHSTVFHYNPRTDRDSFRQYVDELKNIKK